MSATTKGGLHLEMRGGPDRGGGSRGDVGGRDVAGGGLGLVLGAVNLDGFEWSGHQHGVAINEGSGMGMEGSGMGMSFAIATCGAGCSGSLGSVALKLMTPGR